MLKIAIFRSTRETSACRVKSTCSRRGAYTCTYTILQVPPGQNMCGAKAYHKQHPPPNPAMQKHAIQLKPAADGGMNRVRRAWALHLALSSHDMTFPSSTGSTLSLTGPLGHAMRYGRALVYDLLIDRPTNPKYRIVECLSGRLLSLAFAFFFSFRLFSFLF